MLRPGRCSGAVGVLLITAALMSQAASANVTSADRRDQVGLAAVLADNPARSMAIGLSTLAKLHVSSIDLDVVWGGGQDDALMSMTEQDVGLGLLDLDAVDAKAFSGDPSLRAVMKYWPDAEASQVETSKDHPGYLLVAKDSLAPDTVSDLVLAVITDDLILKSSGVDLERLVPATSMVNLPLPLHQGVDDYLAEQRITLLTDTEPPETENSLKRSFTLYFDTDESGLERDDIAIVAEACRFAATLDSARFIISGHTDTVGSNAYNDRLAARRSASVANAIRNDPRFRESLSVLDFGENRLALSTGDGVAEPMNRRVEITVVPGS